MLPQLQNHCYKTDYHSVTCQLHDMMNKLQYTFGFLFRSDLKIFVSSVLLPVQVLKSRILLSADSEPACLRCVLESSMDGPIGKSFVQRKTTFGSAGHFSSIKHKQKHDMTIKVCVRRM